MSFSLSGSAAFPTTNTVAPTLAAYAAAALEVGILNAAYPVRNIRRHGAANDGVTNDLTAFVNAVTSLPFSGGIIDLDEGRPTLAGDLTALHTAINSKLLVWFRGRGATHRSQAGAALGSSPNGTFLYLKNATTYFYMRQAGAKNEALVFENFHMDGCNGLGTTFGSTTCPGYVADNGLPGLFYTSRDMVFSDILYAHSPIVGPVGKTQRERAMFDVYNGTFTKFERCYFYNAGNGRFFFTEGASTTNTFRSCYFSGAREIYYVRDAQSVVFDDCVFESSVCGGAQYRSHVSHIGCHYEGLGTNTGGAAWTTGLTPRNHGEALGAILNAPSTDLVTAFSQLYGTLVIDRPCFNDFVSGAPLLAWFECLGIGAGNGQGGHLEINAPYKTDGSLTFRLFHSTMLFGAAERGTEMTVVFNDAWGIAPVGSVIHNADDARKVSHGRARIEFATNAYQLATIKRGRFCYELQDPGNALIAAPVSWPRNSSNIVGDEVVYPTPVAGGKRGTVCVTAGQPGTWKPWGAIDP